MSKKIVHRHQEYDHALLGEALPMLMANIEDGLVLAGAKPGEDYTHRDLYEGAMRLIGISWKRGKGPGLDFRTEHFPMECVEEGSSVGGSGR